MDRMEILAWVIGTHERERLIEYPFTFRNLEGPRVLDVGSVDSRLPQGLGMLGLDAYGQDLRIYSKQPWFSFVRSDCMRLPFRDASFDQVISISTTEHVGLVSHGLDHLYGPYRGGSPPDPQGDRKNVLEMARVTRQGGSIILTVPYGWGSHYWLRIYNQDTLPRLIEGLKPEVTEYYVNPSPGLWVPASEPEARAMEGIPLPKGVCCLKLRC